jgi:transposase-like protein
MAMLLEEVEQLIRPGYAPMETGYYPLPTGQMYVAALVPMPGCMSHWVDWWFGTYLKDSKTFKEWDPETHLTFKWDKKWRPGQYIGASHYGEYLLGGRIHRFRFVYDDPARYFDTSKFAEAKVGTVICGEAFLPDGTPDGRIIHVVRDKSSGCEMRTRLWLNRATDEIAMLHIEHCVSKMGMLGDLLRRIRGEEMGMKTRLNVNCKICHSEHVVKNGTSKGVQNWLCRDCGYSFVNYSTWPKMRYPIPIVANAVYNYYSGVSMSQICQTIEQETGYLPSTSTVHEWVKKLTIIALDVARKYQPRVSDRWAVDEIQIRYKEKRWWLIYLIDTETRFILSATIFRTRDRWDIKSLLVSASEKAGKAPVEIMTNGHSEYFEAIRLAYGADAPKADSSSNELWENALLSWCDTLKASLRLGDGENVLKSARILLQGFVLHYNYMRINGFLGGTPAQAAIIDCPFRSWLEIIKGYRDNVELSLMLVNK